MGFGIRSSSSAIALLLVLVLVDKSCQSDESSNSKQHQPPCLCNGKYYRVCPSNCATRTKITDRGMFTSGLGETFKYRTAIDHDSDHPDHVEDISVKVKDYGHRNTLFPDEVTSSSDSVESDGETIVRHRKVYLSDKQINPDTVIHPIHLTIPVRVREDITPPLPPPKPVFRMHKYTTYETKPQVEMVPVTTTVIKPVGVSKDQIIED